ncbi:MAG TPA: PIG-L family deacetylase [Thermoanaerobaculia bacterium]|nr:PIG-L family deacetylase [Thermoanaerobaculia bacterium]
MIEAEAIPYEPAQLRGERLLVLAPHPDDEVIGCGGLVAQHLRERREVRVVVATDGAQAGTPMTREEESRRGLAVLGEVASIEFLGVADRALDDAIAPRLREILLDARPDLVLVPSPIEIHPDHAALARAFCELVQRDESLFADLAVTRVAFYEVGQPIRPNALVDISDVADAKYAAIAEHRSQLEARDYIGYARGLNAYRAMTLPGDAKFAEAYYVLDLPSLRTMPFSALRQAVGAPRTIEVTRATVPISVIVRTKDRLAQLREAVDSIRATEYPCEIVVVNDGGARPELDEVTLVHHEQSRGRSEAANAGARAASNAFLVFLDDDDLFYPEHLATLANASSSSHGAWYTDAVSAFLRPGVSGAYETHSRLRLFAQDFDRELLLVDNYIPLPSLLIPRESFLDLGGFDSAFDLFEDWDFLIRLSARGDFLRVPRVTCEVRHFEGGTSVVLAAPEGSERFREAKLRVWEKHASRIDNALFARVFERQKRRHGTVYSDVVEGKGQFERARQDLARLEREKAQLIEQSGEIQGTMNGYILRVRELEGVVAALTAIRDRFEGQTLQLERTEQLVSAQQHEIGRLHEEIDALRRVNAETHEELQRARVEINRLGGLLDMIYRSRTWKIHTFLERMRGRG